MPMCAKTRRTFAAGVLVAPRGRDDAGSGASASTTAGWARVSVLIVHPLLLCGELEPGDHDDDREQDPGSGGGEPEITEGEPLLPDVHDERLGGVARPA